MLSKKWIQYKSVVSKYDKKIDTRGPGYLADSLFGINRACFKTNAFSLSIDFTICPFGNPLDLLKVFYM